MASRKRLFRNTTRAEYEARAFIKWTKSAKENYDIDFAGV